MPPLPTILLAASVGAAAGYIGALMILRRMALVGDALTHVALPGIGLALMLNASPFLGALLLLVIAVTAVWILENKTRLYTEALIGLFFTFSLAIGILMFPEEHDLLEALFGDITGVTLHGALATSLIAILTILAARRIVKPLLLSTISPDLARVRGVHGKSVELVFLLLIALIVALGIKVVGTLLMGALVIVPAITAKNLAKSFSRYALLSVVAGTLSAVVGVWGAYVFTIPSGVAVVLTSTAFFLVSLPLRQRA